MTDGDEQHTEPADRAADGGHVTTRERADESIRERPGPALRWAAIALVLLTPELGALVSFAASLVSVEGLQAASETIPTLLSRETIPNQGANVPGAGWQGTFLGLSPATAWGLRVVAVYLYAGAWGYWLVRGYRVWRREYRTAAWTPRDDVLGRFRGHRWGEFGLLVVAVFVVLVIFAPALGPTTMERAVYEPYSYDVTYYSEQTGSVETITAGAANIDAVSQGIPDRNVAPLTYDDYGRFHPFGTLPSGADLFTAVAAGARVSLFVGLLAITLSALLASALAMVSAYYGGVVDLVVVLVSDATQSLPQLLVVILLSVVLSGTWLAELYSGGVLLAVIFAATGWPSLWRAIRGPALQVSERTWVDAADSVGLAPQTTMRKHIFPYVVGYLLVYASMNLGGIIIGIAGLSFLGLGISPPTPEWGRIVNVGQPYLTTESWHVAVIPGVLIVIVVTGFNALGDGVRDAIDAESTANEETTTAASGAGG